MAKKTEQIDYRSTRNSWRKWKAFIKKQTVRTVRRLGRSLGQDAPSRVTRGWCS